MKFLVITLLGLIGVFSAQAQNQQRRAAPPAKTVTPAYQQPTLIGTKSVFQNELDLNLSAGYLQTTHDGTKNVTDIKVLVVYSYDLRNQIQVGADVGLQVYDSTTQLQIFGTGTYNLYSDYSNSVFAKAGVGLHPVRKFNATTNKIDDKNEFAFYLGGGKRFEMWNHVTYKPMAALIKINDLDMQFLIQFLNISFYW